MWRKLLIKLNNRIITRRHVSVPPENLLLILPHCLQHEACKQTVTSRLDECKQCGTCQISEILNLRNTYGIACAVAGGGQQALALTSNPAVKAVVAVACEKELFQGIVAAFPKPVFAIPNTTPDGPCRNTRVNIQEITAAITTITTTKG